MNFESKPEVWSVSSVYHKQVGNKISISSKEPIDSRPRLSQKEKKKKDLGDFKFYVPPWLQPKQPSSHQVSVLVTASCLAPSTMSGTINVYQMNY